MSNLSKIGFDKAFQIKVLLAARSIALQYDAVTNDSDELEYILEDFEDCQDKEVVVTAMKTYEGYSASNLEDILIGELRELVNLK